MKLSPYLFLTSTCEPALAFYAACGLGAVTTLLRWGDKDMPVRTEALRGKIMHARFEGPEIGFFAGDNDDAEPMRGCALMLEISDRQRAQDLFTRLSAGGEIMVPFGLQMWGDVFGSFRDAFGVQWMINCAKDASINPLYQPAQR